jgi:hypothetical protein
LVYAADPKVINTAKEELPHLFGNWYAIKNKREGILTAEEYIKMYPVEESNQELIKRAEEMADACEFHDFAETLFKLGNRGISRDKGLELIARFKKDCDCHNFMDDWDAEEQ